MSKHMTIILGIQASNAPKTTGQMQSPTQEDCHMCDVLEDEGESPTGVLCFKTEPAAPPRNRGISWSDHNAPCGGFDIVFSGPIVFKRTFSEVWVGTLCWVHPWARLSVLCSRLLGSCVACCTTGAAQRRLAPPAVTRRLRRRESEGAGEGGRRDAAARPRPSPST